MVRQRAGSRPGSQERSDLDIVYFKVLPMMVEITTAVDEIELGRLILAATSILRMRERVSDVHKRTDHNQAEIVEALRAAGASVTSLAGVGCGCPDLIVGYQEHNLLMEVKNPNGRGQLTPMEEAWIKAWRGQVAVVFSIRDALSILEDLLIHDKETFGKDR